MDSISCDYQSDRIYVSGILLQSQISYVKEEDICIYEIFVIIYVILETHTCESENKVIIDLILLNIRYFSVHIVVF